GFRRTEAPGFLKGSCTKFVKSASIRGRCDAEFYWNVRGTARGSEFDSGGTFIWGRWHPLSRVGRRRLRVALVAVRIRQIRQGVKWSDGTDLTAEDVNFTINYNIQSFFHLWAFEPYVNRIVGCTPQQPTGCGAVNPPSAPWQVTVYFDRPFAPGKIMFIPI